MGKEKHNFCDFFYLCTADNPKANKKAVCFSCIRKHTLPIIIIEPECFVPNKAILCRNHLKKCENFASEYHESEIQEILSRKVPEDEKKIKESELDINRKLLTDKEKELEKIQKQRPTLPANTEKDSSKLN